MTFGEKISELNPTIEATVESRGREGAGADVGLVCITGHSGRFVVDPYSTDCCRWHTHLEGQQCARLQSPDPRI